MEYGTEDWDAEYWIEAMAQYDTRIKWSNVGRTAEGKLAKSISFRITSYEYALCFCLQHMFMIAI